MAISQPRVASAQVFEPVRIQSSTEGWNTRNSVLVQFSRFNWEKTEFDASNGLLLDGEFSLGKSFGVGLWLASDRQSLYGESANIGWANLHLSWNFIQKPAQTFGIAVGGLAAHIEAPGTKIDANWAQIDLLASFALDYKADQPSRWTLGLSTGPLIGQTNGKGDFRTNDGWTFGTSVSYRINKTLSANASYWRMDLKEGAAINRANMGIGFHF